MIDATAKTILTETRAQIEKHFTEELIPFWTERSVDREYGGYLLDMDADGQRIEDKTDKHLVTQARMIWSFSLISRYLPNTDVYKEAARQGVDFFIDHFWDEEYGGWYAETAQNGDLILDYKFVYGQSFACYALAEYYLATGDERGLEYAGRTFDLLQRNCADLVRGGYYESMARDWTFLASDHFSDTLKSVNTHMHLMEAFTTLYQASGDMIHARRLQELVDLTLKHMLHPAGSAYDWFDLEFTPQPSPALTPSWQPSPEETERLKLDAPTYLTSYGHNIELSWFIVRACEALGKPGDTYVDALRGLVNHALENGFDWELGGVYRDGSHEGAALLDYKEWWQQGEAMIGLIYLYDLTREKRYLDAFKMTWDFVNQHTIHHSVGEWRPLLTRTGAVIKGDMGDPWKSAYHTARALYESLKRIDAILESE